MAWQAIVAAGVAAFGGVLALSGVLALGIGCAREDTGKGGSPVRARELRYPVETARVEARRVEYVVHATGSIEAYERVHVAARVAGAVEDIRFREGDEVKSGQVLAHIDVERYAIAVRSAEAVLARSEANEAEARAGLARRERLVSERPGLIPAEELETWRTKAQAAAAEVAEAKAGLVAAELNQRYAHASAPAAGVIETRSVETGQYVQPGTLLATLVRRDPLVLRFQVPEREARALHKGMPATFSTGSGGEPMHAQITHVAQSADPGTRLVQVAAEIDDARRSQLRPGSFAEATVAIGTRDAAPVVPQIAVRASEKGFLAYVIEGQIARERILELGMRTEDGVLEVKSGVRPGELLVVRGAEALSEGSKVVVVPAPGGAGAAGSADAGAVGVGASAAGSEAGAAAGARAGAGAVSGSGGFAEGAAAASAGGPRKTATGGGTVQPGKESAR